MSFSLLDKITLSIFFLFRTKLKLNPKTNKQKLERCEDKLSKDPTHISVMCLYPWHSFPVICSLSLFHPFPQWGCLMCSPSKLICPVWHSHSDCDPLVSLLCSTTTDAHDGLRSSPCSSTPEDTGSGQMWPQLSATSSIFSGHTYSAQGICHHELSPPPVLTIVCSGKLTQLPSISYVVTFHLLIDWKLAMLKKEGGRKKSLSNNVPIWSE